MKQLSYQAKVLIVGGLLLCAPLMSLAQACCTVSRYAQPALGIVIVETTCSNPEANTAWVEDSNGNVIACYE